MNRDISRYLQRAVAGNPQFQKYCEARSTCLCDGHHDASSQQRRVGGGGGLSFAEQLSISWAGGGGLAPGMHWKGGEVPIINWVQRTGQILRHGERVLQIVW